LFIDRHSSNSNFTTAALWWSQLELLFL
jgi:hypothetical protein